MQLTQPVSGAARATSADGWKRGKLCDVSAPPWNARNGTNATAALQAAIDTCGDLPGGGTVIIRAPLTLWSASLFLRSNLTFRVERGATLLGTATGSMATPESVGDAPLIYARRNSLMTEAHAGLLNGARCVEKKRPLVGWDDCARWSKLQNVAIEGGGLLDADGDAWYEVWAKQKGMDGNQRPMMLDLMWINGLTIRDMQIRRPGYWTVHPTFCNNVRVTNNSIITYGSNTDGVDPDSSWNVYIAHNTFSTGDDCIAIKAGRDWSGRMVNISTQHVLAEANIFAAGHGVSIGSETSGWVRNVIVRDSELHGTNLAVRIKSMRGRGGGVENVVYEGLRGSVNSAVQLTLNYNSASPTNDSATPVLRNVTIRNLALEATEGNLQCDGLSDSIISGITFDNVTITGKGVHESATCKECIINARESVPKPHCSHGGARSAPVDFTPIDFTPFESDVLPAWLARFTLDYNRGRFAFHAGSNVPDIYGTIDVVHVLGTVGQLASFSDRQRDAWAATVNSFQDASTGFFATEHGAPGHQPFHAAGEATASLALLGRRPRFNITNFTTLAEGGEASWQAFYAPLVRANGTACYKKKLGGNNIHSCGQILGAAPAVLAYTSGSQYMHFLRWWAAFIAHHTDRDLGVICPIDNSTLAQYECLGGGMATHGILLGLGLGFELSSPTALLEFALRMQQADGLWNGDSSSMSLDGVFQAVRASLQLGKVQWPRVKAACEKLLRQQARLLNNKTLVLSKHANDSHTLPNAVANVAECAQAFPELVKTQRPWSCCARYV